MAGCMIEEHIVALVGLAQTIISKNIAKYFSRNGSLLATTSTMLIGLHLFPLLPFYALCFATYHEDHVHSANQKPNRKTDDNKLSVVWTIFFFGDGGVITTWALDSVRPSHSLHEPTIQHRK